jgi:hypothetical protein
MCWNADVSLNTFLFCSFALCFIYLANTYTKYKTPTFENPFTYLFLFAVVSMQLIEYFLWKNLTNKSLNHYYSKIAWIVVISQPFFLMLMIQGWLRYGMIGLYGLFWLIFSYLHPNFGGTDFYTSVGKNGHLNWEWMNGKFPNKNKVKYIHLVYLFFYVASLLLIHNIWLSMFILISLVFSVFFYYSYETWGTMWCWYVNLFLLYFVIHILLVQPFLEYNALC